MFVKRPKPSEDVTDLEKQQENFLSARLKASVTLKRVNPSDERGAEEEASKPALKKQSRFKAEREQARGRATEATESSLSDVVMQDLVERPGTSIYVPAAPTLENLPIPFPTVTRRDPSIPAQEGKSIFMSCVSAQQRNPEAPESQSAGEMMDSEYEAIHQENLRRLQAMSMDEILQAQSELLGKLDPNLVSFIKSRKSKPKPAAQQILRGGSQMDDAALQQLLASERVAPAGPSTAEFVEEELPLDPSEMSKFPNMNAVEKEKLAWMTLLPTPEKSDDNRKFTCRFDLEGRILAPDADFPTQSGLHHHGDEPERAGYTIDELAKLLASAVQSQRILALQVFSNILINHHCGKYDKCFPDGPGLIESLVENGFPTLLRVTLDDQGATQLSEALRTLHSLIVSLSDEICLDLICDWTDEEPYLTPAIENLQSAKTENVNQLSDSELIAIDIVRGLVRMNVLPRIRYLLEVCQPDAGAVAAALGVLTRIARHCPESAKSVAECPRLCSFIIKAYLPLYGWRVPQIVAGKLATSGGVPLALAMKFVRVLCQSSKPAAVKLLVEHRLERLIASFLNLDPDENKLPKQELLRLQLEALRLLRVLLRHGLASPLFDDLSPIIIRQMQFAKQISCQSTHGDQQLFDLQYASCLIQCVHARMRSIVLKDPEDWTSLSKPIIDAAVTACQRWLRNLCADNLRFTAFGALSVVLRFLADIRCHKKDVDILPVISALLSVPQKKWTSLWHDLEQHSMVLLKAEKSGDLRDVRALTSLATIQFAEESVIPLANENNPVFFLDSVLYFIWTGVAEEVSDSTKLAVRMLDDEGLNKYLKRLESSDLSSSWFSRTESSLLYRMLRLCEVLSCKKNSPWLEYPSGPDLGFFRECALKLLPLLSPDRAIAVRSILNLIYNPRFILNSSSVVEVMAKHVVIADKSCARGLVEESIDDLRSVKSYVMDTVNFLSGSIAPKYLESSLSKSSQCEFLFTGPLLPKDWMYFPLRMLYAESLKQGKPAQGEAKSENQETTSNLEPILRCLQNVLLLACTSSCLKKLHPLVNYMRLASVFVIDCETFLDTEAKTLLEVLFLNLVAPLSLKMEFDQHSFKWDGLPAFSDFYPLLIEQFGACSYGDSVFSDYLLCPLQMSYHKDIRKVLYIENAPVLRAITSEHTEVDISNFTEPRETDPDLLIAYRSALSSGIVVESRNLLMYKIITAHLS